MPFPDLNPALQRTLAAQGYAEPTPVQAAVLEEGGGGRDLLVSAQTGSGKTVGYGLAMAESLLDGAEQFGPAGPPLALVIAPTRELALQVHGELRWLYAETGARLVTCVGGMDPRREQRDLAQGAHVVVGTPGRLKDHLERGNLDLSGLRVLVLDEADEMLDLGFRDDLEFLLDASPAERRTLLFSATIARDIAALARRYQREAVRIDTVSRDEPHGDIEYRAIRVAPGELENAVVNVLRFFEARGALVFCHTREAVRHLHARLVERGFSAVALSGELSQSERTHALQALRDGRARVCVATDVAARGLDLPDLGLVIHAELPTNRAALLHRSGRTGRAGKKGVSVLLAPLNRARKAEVLIRAAGVDAAWSGPPSAEAIRKRDAERLLEDPILAGDLQPEDAALAQSLMQGRSAEQIAAALIRLHRQRLPEPEELFDPGPVGGYGSAKPQRAPRGGEGVQDGGQDGAVWFRLNVGRSKNADPKWLIPLICRLGHVTKPDIGAIRIFDRDTRFEISPAVAERFAQASSKASEGDLRITPAEGPAGKDAGPPAKRPPFKRGLKPGGPKSNAARPGGYGAPRAKPAERKPGGYGRREG
jgi:ATP-dependent RNA helicase DeaD